VHAGGTIRVVGVMADFWIRPDHRSLGPAVKLQRACVEQAAALGFGFYDLPQGNMAAVYARMGLLGCASLIRFAKPLRAGAFVARFMPSGAAARATSALGDALLKVPDLWTGRVRGLEVVRYEDDFDAEFDRLAATDPQAGIIHVARSADYLRWRYRRHYHLEHCVFTARDRTGLRAYAVTVDSGRHIELLDIYPVKDAAVLTALLAGIVRASRPQEAVALTASALPGATALGQAFSRIGLRPRDRRPFVVHEFATGNADAMPPAPEDRWYLAYGDIDY
jgi:hypothetical protein